MVLEQILSSTLSISTVFRLRSIDLDKFVLSCTSYFPQTDNLLKVDSHVIQSDGKNLDFRQIFHLLVLNYSKYTSLYSPNLMPMREVI